MLALMLGAVVFVVAVFAICRLLDRGGYTFNGTSSYNGNDRGNNHW